MQGKGQTYKAEWQNGQIVLTQREGLAGTTQDGSADITSTPKGQDTQGSGKTQGSQGSDKTGKAQGTDKPDKKGETQKAGEQVKGQSGRYAVKNPDGTYTYYSHNGKKLNPTYARLADPVFGKLNDPRFDKDNNMKSEYPKQDEMAKKYGGRKTEQADIYYDEAKKQHFKSRKILRDGKIITLKVTLPNVRSVWAVSWVDQQGKRHKGRP